MPSIAKNKHVGRSLRVEVYEIDEKIKNDDDGRADDKRPWQNAPGIFQIARQ